MKYQLRTKTYIIIAIINLLAVLSSPVYAMNLGTFYSLFLKNIPVIINTVFVTMLYAASVILLFQESKQIQKAGWILAIIPTAIILLNPLPSLSTNSYGFLIGTVQGLLAGDAITATLNITASIVPIIILILAISMLAGCKSKKADKTITIILAIAYVLTRFAEPAILVKSWPHYISPILTSAIFLTALLIWRKNK